ncbi:MAG: protease inhibitor I42 family protein [bacterium]|nr:protease inhibitor I42 family protein [bacterium]
MRRAILALAAVALLALRPHSPVFTDADAAHPIVVSAGEEFFIALPSNTTTGFAWTQSLADAKVAAYEGNVYQPPSNPQPGAGGQQIFIYHANRSGTTAIKLAYARPFEPAVLPAKVLTFFVTVR